MREPRELAHEIEREAEVPEGSEDRFAGYTLIGLPFASGHILALRRFVASSIGPSYYSVWHRDPAGRWTFYQNVMPRQGCSRYFGKIVSESLVEEIDIEWPGPREFAVKVGGEKGLEWRVKVKPTTVTRALNLLGGLIPDPWWQDERVLSLMTLVARVSLRTGKLQLSGQTPNGQSFVANPQTIWLVTESRAVIRGEEIGPVGPHEEQARLGDLWIPQKGIFAVGRAFLSSTVALPTSV